MPFMVQADEVAFLPGGCGALAGAFRNYDMLSTPQRQQLLQARLLSPPPAGYPTLGLLLQDHANRERHVQPQQRF